MSQIDFKNVSKKYEPDFEALKKVSFSVENGEFVFIVGPSGAGKSTLIKLLIREDLPDEGQVLFNGEDVSQIEQSRVPELRRKIGVVFQDFKLLESRTVYENIAVALEVVDAEDKVIKSVVPNVLSLVELTDKSDYYPNQLSGGEKQRVAIARALAHEPDVLVADEPTGMIDPDAAQGVLEVLEKVNSLGTTIIMATHNEKIVDEKKERVIRLDKGVLVSDKKGGYRE